MGRRQPRFAVLLEDQWWCSGDVCSSGGYGLITSGRAGVLIWIFDGIRGCVAFDLTHFGSPGTSQSFFTWILSTGVEL